MQGVKCFRYRFSFAHVRILSLVPHWNGLPDIKYRREHSEILSDRWLLDLSTWRGKRKRLSYWRGLNLFDVSLKFSKTQQFISEPLVYESIFCELAQISWRKHLLYLEKCKHKSDFQSKKCGKKPDICL